MDGQNNKSIFERGTVVISIDDGNSEDFRLYKNILSKHRLSATFNIVTNNVDSSNAWLTKEQLRVIHSDPLMEIAAHGHIHKNYDEDILQGIDCLRDWLKIDSSSIGFASPGSVMKNDFIKENEEHLRSLGLLYVRTSINTQPSERHIELQHQLEKMGVSEYVLKNVPNLTYFFDDMCVNSVVVYNKTEACDLKKLIDLAITEKACIVFMFHRIKKTGEHNYDNTWSYCYDKFCEFAEYLAEMRDRGIVDVLTNKQAFLAGLEK